MRCDYCGKTEADDVSLSEFNVDGSLWSTVCNECEGTTPRRNR